MKRDDYTSSCCPSIYQTLFPLVIDFPPPTWPSVPLSDLLRKQSLLVSRLPLQHPRSDVVVSESTQDAQLLVLVKSGFLWFCFFMCSQENRNKTTTWMMSCMNANLASQGSHYGVLRTWRCYCRLLVLHSRTRSPVLGPSRVNETTSSPGTPGDSFPRLNTETYFRTSRLEFQARQTCSSTSTTH